MNWVVSFLLVILAGVVGLCISTANFLADLKARIYPNGNQTLATTCYVDERMEKEKGDGYVTIWGKKKDVFQPPLLTREEYDHVIATFGGEKKDYMIVRETKRNILYYIPKKDFYKYPTKEELAQMYKKVMK
jgi:hypothetical protein